MKKRKELQGKLKVAEISYVGRGRLGGGIIPIKGVRKGYETRHGFTDFKVTTEGFSLDQLTFHKSYALPFPRNHEHNHKIIDQEALDELVDLLDGGEDVSVKGEVELAPLIDRLSTSLDENRYFGVVYVSSVPKYKFETINKPHDPDISFQRV